MPLQAISTLRVKKFCDFGAGIREEAVITVIDRQDAMERKFLGDEVYQKYTEYKAQKGYRQS